MSTGTKISIGAGAAALVLALVIGAIIVLPTGDDEDTASAFLDTSETTAPEDESSETVEDEGDDNPFGGPADDPETQVYTGSGDEIIDLDEPHSDPRIATIEGDDYTHVNLRDRNGDPSGAMGSAAEGFDRLLYHFHPRYEEETTQLEVLSTATSWTITLGPLSTAKRACVMRLSRTDVMKPPSKRTSSATFANGPDHSLPWRLINAAWRLSSLPESCTAMNSPRGSPRSSSASASTWRRERSVGSS